MPLIPVTEIKPGMTLAKPILRANDGLILFQNDIELKQVYIDRIKSLDLESVWVRDNPAIDESDFLEPIKEETRMRATSILRTTFSQLKEQKNLDIVKLKNLVKEILDYILSDDRVVYTIIKINAYDIYTFTHSVDVCVIAILIGSIMDLKRNELEILGICSLLHDVGKIFLDFRILNKPSKLESIEYEQIKAHTWAGYEFLKSKESLSYLIPHMALQHHEREDGSGYPRGLKGKEIHRYAKIIAVADVFNAMTSQRIYQDPVPASLAVQEIYENTPLKYNQDVVEHFRKIVTPYSKQSILLLSNHQTVEVIETSRKNA
jgi:HD-GYP domain-containing protein (c-di-GMP phosphodiesterase class II)